MPEFLNASECAAADGSLSDDMEPGLHLVEPGSICWSEVHVISWSRSKPAFYFRMLVGAVVVNDQMDVQVGRSIRINVSKELEKLLMAMSCFVLSEDLAGGDIKSGEESGCAMTDVIMTDAFNVSQPHGKHWLGSFKCLNLTFLIDAKHHGFIRRIKVEARDITYFLYEEWIRRKLEMFLPVWLQPEGMPNALYS